METEVIDGNVVNTVVVPEHADTDTVELVVTPADPAAPVETVLVDEPAPVEDVPVDVPAEVAPAPVEDVPVAPAEEVVNE